MLSTAGKKLYQRILAGEQPTRRDQAVLSHLIELELVAQNRRDDRYEALNPETAVRHLQTSLQLTATRALTEAQLVNGRFQELTAAYGLAHPGGTGAGADIVTGFPAINERLEVMVSSCQTELLTAHPTGPRPAHVLAMSYKRDLGVLERGAKMRTIYLPSARHDGPTARWATTMTEHGAKIKTSNNFGRVIIVDRRVAVTSVLDLKAEKEIRLDQALFITSEEVVRTLVAAFERDWIRAACWDGTPGGPVLSDQQRDLLRLLGEGNEVAAAAEKLGISPRTAATRVAEAKAEVGTDSLAGLLYWFGRHEFQI